MQAIAEHYPAHVQTCPARADAALAASGHDHLLIHSGSEIVAFLDDLSYPFRSNPHFRAWLPLHRHPDCWLLYTPGQRPVVLYHQPRDFWHLPPSDPQGYWVDAYDVRVVREASEVVDHLPLEGRLAVIAEHVPTELPARAQLNPSVLIDHLHWSRGVKTAYELACMREANRRAAPAHYAAREAFLQGASEYDIHLAYCRACSHTEAELPYPNIIGVNEHAAVLHYQHRDREAAPRRSLLVDAGATYAGYASDITRTTCVDDGPFTELVDAMDAAQRALCEAVRPGLAFGDLHREAHRRIGDVLHEAGVIRIGGADAQQAGLTRYFFPHGLGHLIGAQVHDVGGQMAGPDGSRQPPPEDFPHLRLTRTLETDMVVTIEPGVYFIDLLLDALQQEKLASEVHWPVIEKLRPWGGVRIEDDVRVGAPDHENLTRAWLP